MQRVPMSKGLSIKARLALANETAYDAESVCAMDDNEFTFDGFLSNGVRSLNLRVAGIGPAELRARGAETALHLRQLGYDALDICDPRFCAEAQLAYGSNAVISAFLQTPADAVAISSMECQHTLKISVEQLLERCAGAPTEAIAVVEQQPTGVALQGVPARVLLDAGLRADSLRQLGYGLASIVQQVNPTAAELNKLGYTV